MRSAFATEPESTDRLEIPSLRLFDRVSGIVVVGAAGALFAFLAFAQQSRGHEVGYLVSGAFVWWALYFASLPGIKVALDPVGIEFADMSWAIFFRYPRYRVAWRDVVEIGSRTVASKYGNFIETRVKVRISEVPLATRRVAVTSRDPGYYAFLKQLKAHVDPSAVAEGGMGIDPGEIGVVDGQISYSRLQLLLGLFIGSLLLVGIAYITRR